MSSLGTKDNGDSPEISGNKQDCSMLLDSEGESTPGDRVQISFQVKKNFFLGNYDTS